MRNSELQELVRRLALDATASGGETIARARASADPQALIAAALFDPSAGDLLARAARLARSTTDRQLVAIVTAHLAGDHAHADALIRDHLVDHPGNAIVDWIRAFRGISGAGAGSPSPSVARQHLASGRDDRDDSSPTGEDTEEAGVHGTRVEQEQSPRTTKSEGHIGRIVAGSLVGGLLGAVALVAGPLAGASEHVITGSVLLVFSLAWTTIAILSERRTDQPQRWAKLPAAFMALTGAGVVAVARTSDTLTWAWPPALLALVVWMLVRARRDLHSRTRPLMLYPVFAALVLVAIGGLYQAEGQAADHGAYAMPGRLIDVGGHRLHISCTGTGSPTVVLEPGLGEPSTMMSGWIAPDVADTTRVCVYDRAGRGWSDSADGPQDGRQGATDLHTLLERAHVSGPYVLAGHSAGGAYVLNFARLYPEQVAGVVLLDSMHPDQYTKLPGWRGFYATLRRASALLPSASRFGVERLLSRSAANGLPPRARDEQRAFWSSPRHYRSLRDETFELRNALAQAGRLTALGHRPLVVLTAGRGAQRGWLPLQDDLATLSTNSVHRILPGVTHAMLTEDKTAAAESSRAIRDVVDAVRNGTRLGASAVPASLLPEPAPSLITPPVAEVTAGLGGIQPAGR